MNQPIKVILIEDNAEYRYAIEFSLKNDPQVELCQQFGTAELALRELQLPTTEDNRPDLILLDLNLPGMSGHDTIPWLKKYVPNTKIIVLTQSDKDEDVLKALNLGASGYLLKSALIENIQQAITSVMQGGGALDPKVVPAVLHQIEGQTQGPESPIALTPREIETLELLAAGLQKKEIANKLEIGISTVSTYTKSIFIKLEVSNAPAAIAKAYESRILPAKKG